MNGFPVAPPADAHGLLFRPTEMVGEGSKAAAEPLEADLWEIVCSADAVDPTTGVIVAWTHTSGMILEQLQQAGNHDGDNALREGGLVLLAVDP